MSTEFNGWIPTPSTYQLIIYQWVI